MLKRFLEQLVKEMEIPMPEEHAQGEYECIFAPQIRVQFTEHPDTGIRLFSALAEVPNPKTEEFLHLAMAANLFGQEVGENFLGLDKDGKKVTITRFINKESQYQDFKVGLEEFLNYAETWKTDTEVYLS